MSSASRESCDELRAALDELEELDLERAEVDALVERLRGVCDVSATPTRRASGARWHRARRVEGAPRSLEELWYPRPEQVTELGRANDVGESILYASDSANTAIGEVGPDTGELVAVLSLVPRDPADLARVHAIGVGESPGPRGGPTDEDAGPEDPRRVLREFVERQFTRVVDPGKPHEYALSVALAKLHRLPGMDGLWYPSSAVQYRGTNLALLPESADRCLRAASCRVVRIEGPLAEHAYRVRAVHESRAIDADGTIHW